MLPGERISRIIWACGIIGLCLYIFPDTESGFVQFFAMFCLIPVFYGAIMLLAEGVTGTDIGGPFGDFF